MKISHLPIEQRREIRLSEKAEMLDNSIWGNDLTWNAIEYIAKYFDVYDLSPGINILHEGSKLTPYMGLIIKGKVHIIKTDASGANKDLANIGQGRTFGEMSVIDGLVSSATVITTTAVTLMVLDKESFHRLIDDNPIFSNKFLLMLLKLMSSRIRETSGKLVEFVDASA